MNLSGSYTCACGTTNDNNDAATLWIDTPIGMTTLRTCKTQACAKRAVAELPEGWKLRKNNQPPKPKGQT